MGKKAKNSTLVIFFFLNDFDFDMDVRCAQNEHIRAFAHILRSNRTRKLTIANVNNADIVEKKRSIYIHTYETQRAHKKITNDFQG